MSEVDVDQLDQSVDVLREAGFEGLADRLEAAARRARELEADE